MSRLRPRQSRRFTTLPLRNTYGAGRQGPAPTAPPLDIDIVRSQFELHPVALNLDVGTASRPFWSLLVPVREQVSPQTRGIRHPTWTRPFVSGTERLSSPRRNHISDNHPGSAAGPPGAPFIARVQSEPCLAEAPAPCANLRNRDRPPSRAAEPRPRGRPEQVAAIGRSRPATDGLPMVPTAFRGVGIPAVGYVIRSMCSSPPQDTGMAHGPCHNRWRTQLPDCQRTHTQGCRRLGGNQGRDHSHVHGIQGLPIRIQHELAGTRSRRHRV